MNGPIYTRGRARRSLIDTVAFRVLSQLATVLGYVILVRGMPEQQFGILNLLYSFIAVIGTVLSLGLEQVLQRYQPQYLRTGNQAAAAWLMRTIASARLAANVLMLVIVLLAWSYIAPIFKLGPYRSVFILFSVLLLVHFQSRVLQLALGSHMLHRYSVSSMSILAVLKLVVYAVLYGLHRLSLEAAIFTDTAAYLCTYVYLRFAYQRQCLTPEARAGYKPEREEWRKLVRYGLLNNFNDAGVLLLYSTVDNFFIAAYLDTLSVGIYSFYSRLRQMVLNAVPGKLFENIVQPLFFSIPADQADRRIPLYFSFLLNMNLLLMWPALAFTCAYHSQLVNVVFAGKFVADSWLLPLLMAFATVNIVADPASLVVQYEEKPGILLVSKLFAAYNILAMIVLVPFLGIYGAALAGGTAQTMKNAFIWWHVRKRAVWVNARASVLCGVGLWGAAVAACYGLKGLLHAPALVHLALGAVVFIVTGLIYTRSPAISTSDRDILKAVMPAKATGLFQRVGLLPAAG